MLLVLHRSNKIYNSNSTSKIAQKTKDILDRRGRRLTSDSIWKVQHVGLAIFEGRKNYKKANL
jgi:hypothetical protein